MCQNGKGDGNGGRIGPSGGGRGRLHLDEADPIQGSYTFEVSSAGADRVLKKEAHFVQFQGAEVELKLYRPREGRKEFVGVLKGYEDGAVTLDIAGEEISFEKPEVAQVRLYPRF